MRARLAVLIIILVLIIDQSLKFWIKTNMYYGQEISVIGDWFLLNFVENEGMAFGMAYGGDVGKVLLTIFRIIAVSFIGYFLVRLIKRKYPKGLVISMALIFAGAMGNIIDSLFYGMIFSESNWHRGNIAEFLPDGGGYGGLFFGKVVDMFYFPLFRGYYPDWFPIIGGESFLFFRPVFNVADAAITVGVLIILVFQKRFFGAHIGEDKKEPSLVTETMHSEPDPSTDNNTSDSKL